MRKGLLRVLSAAVVLVPVVGLAQTRPRPDLSYNYVELSYDESDFDVAGGNNIDGDGFTLAGSYEINDDWHVYAAYGTDDLDFGIDLDQWRIGAGYRYGLRSNIDLYGRVLYIRENVHAPGPFDGDEDGLGLQFRIRSRVSRQLELEGGIQYVDVDGTDTSLQASARYHFTNRLSAAIGLTFGGDADGIGVSARYSF